MSKPDVDAYLRSVLAARAVPTGLLSPVGHVMAALEPVIRGGNQFIVSINPNGRRYLRIVDFNAYYASDQTSNYHSLYSNKTGSWLQTNVIEHIRIISQSGRLEEIKLLKVWRNRFGLDFPSFYLELFTLDALSGRRIGNLSPNIVTVLEAIRDKVANRAIIDPANTNNIVSNTLNATEKAMLAQAARNALASMCSYDCTVASSSALSRLPCQSGSRTA